MNPLKFQNHILILILSSLTLFTSIAAGSAQPLLPDTFYGTVEIAGIPAPNGTKIDVYLNGEYLECSYPRCQCQPPQEGNEGVSCVITEDGYYTIHITGGTAGDPVNFLINGVCVGSAKRGDYIKNINLSLSPTSSLNINATSEEGWINISKDISPELSLSIKTNRDVTNQPVTISIYKGDPISAFRLENKSQLKTFEITIDNSIVDYAILRVYYSQEEIEGINENSLELYYYNESTGSWERLPNQGINTEKNYVWAEVTHFSTYGLFGEELFCGDGICNSEIGETCSSCPEDCGECSQPSNPASGGSSGGGGFFVSQPEECIPEWECSPWSQCINGSQTRKCVDVNNCNTTEDKPPEKQACGLKSILTEECESGITRCVGKSLWKCENGVWKKIYECENGCSNGKCIESIEQNISSSTTNNKSSFPIAGLFTEEIKETLTAILLLIVIIIAILIYKIKFK